MQIKVVDIASGVAIGTKHNSLTVPDGHWVAKGIIRSSLWDDTNWSPDGVADRIAPLRIERSSVICLDRGSVKKHVAKLFVRTSHRGAERLWVEDCVWVSPTPFAVFIERSFPGRDGGPRQKAREFIGARQIHKGELGRALPLPKAGMNAVRDEKSNKLWVGLRQLEALANQDAGALFRNFLDRVPFSWRGETYVACDDVDALKAGGYDRFANPEPFNWDHVWVVLPLAKIILQLIGVGLVNGINDLERIYIRN
jgi:hypothetical protein